MDLAYSYDHVINTEDRAVTPTPPNAPSSSDTTSTSTDPTTPKSTPTQPTQSLQTEFQETFKAFSASPWGAKLGGLWGNVRKQGESYYEEAVREAEAARIDAVKGFNDIKEGIAGRVRSLSINEKEALESDKSEATTAQDREPVPGEEPVPMQDNVDQARVLQENENFLERFKAEAAKRLKDVQKAEDAADDALLKFGTNIRNFLRDAVAVTAPDDSEQPGEVLFESKDSSGKRMIHASRMDAQLHLIHTTTSRFMQDPADSGAEWETFDKQFDIDQKTNAIAKDLDTYPELRRTMEALVPEKVDYTDFWLRYYFLRQALEAQEDKRRELLKGKRLVFCLDGNGHADIVIATANDTEEVAWDEDSDDEDDKNSTPQTAVPQLVTQNTNDSSATVNQSRPAVAGGLKPEGRRSHDEKSVADSEASYDIVSGAPSRAASSPKEKKAEESDEDWE